MTAAIEALEIPAFLADMDPSGNADLWAVAEALADDARRGHLTEANGKREQDVRAKADRIMEKHRHIISNRAKTDAQVARIVFAEENASIKPEENEQPSAYRARLEKLKGAQRKYIARLRERWGLK